MGALLAMIPGKDLFLAAVVGAVLIAGGSWMLIHDHNERMIGEQKIEVADKKLADAQLQHDKDVQAVAELKFKQTDSAYAKAITVPVLDAPIVRLCGPTKPSASGVVSRAATTVKGGSSDIRRGASDTGSAPQGRDIGPDLIGIGQKANAYIAALKAENAALRAEMERRK